MRLLHRSLWSALALIVTPLISVAVAQIQQQGRPSPTTADVAAAATPATVTILAIGANNDTLALGSGFIIRESGVIVTNFHVLRGASDAVVLLASKERFTRVIVLDADSTLDLALLKIPGAGLPSLSTRMTIPRVGEKVIAIGSPLGLSQTVSEGILSATRMAGGHELVQITAPISHGSSGGAVLDAQGRVFAVSTSVLAEGQALNFAVPVRYAIGLLGYDPHPRSIAEAFAGAGTEQRTATATTTLGADRVRAVRPRSSVSGIYLVQQTIALSDSSSIETQVGYLLATEHVGLLALAAIPKRDSLGPTHIYDVDRWATAANGDVVLASGAATWDGYQTTDGGFFAKGQYARQNQTAMYSMSGIPRSLPLSRPDGLYSVSTRTRYRSTRGQLGPDVYDWRGELVVAFANDTMYAAMYLVNEKGGNIYFRAHGPLIEHQGFDLQATNSARLKGVVRNGLISAMWEDVRPNGGAFVGNLSAERK